MAGALLGLFWLAQAGPILPYVDEACAQSFACQKEVIWELVLNGQVISEGDMTQEECQKELKAVEMQTKPFADLECRPRLVERQEA